MCLYGPAERLGVVADAVVARLAEDRMDMPPKGPDRREDDRAKALGAPGVPASDAGRRPCEWE
jgi:hypothetical protein